MVEFNRPRVYVRGQGVVVFPRMALQKKYPTEDLSPDLTEGASITTAARTIGGDKEAVRRLITHKRLYKGKKKLGGKLGKKKKDG